jgi:asparagine synthase (glutamine-hydrolysing)
VCGFSGELDLTRTAADPVAVACMTGTMADRGPDGAGLWAQGPVALGHRRLKIIDLTERAAQPMVDGELGVTVVFNGCIYNHHELRRELEWAGYRFFSTGDTEVLVKAYRHWGDAFVEHLKGMFAFCLVERDSGRVVLGRDRLGIKPLYVYRDSRRLAFASEAKALLALPGIAPRIDRTALRSYLNLGYVAAPNSIFQGIEKLPPARLLSVEGERVEERRYWRIPDGIEQGVREEAWIERVRVRLDEAVRMQMVSDVPIGAFLSGGIDSSAVVGLMASHSDRPIRTYSIGFEGAAAEAYYNELPYARQVAKLFGTEHHEIVVRPDTAALLPRLLWHLDEPISDTAFITTYLVSQFARQDVKVILSGVGGDELFGGYRRYLGDHYQGYYERLPAWMRRAAASAGKRLPSDRHSALLNLSRLAKGFLESADLPFEARYRSYVEVFPETEAERLLRADGGAGRDPIAEAFRQAGSADGLNRMLAVDAETQLPDDLLLLTDKMSMATSLECRVPLLDHELVELAARIPQEVKIRNGRLKHVLKEAVSGMLPRDLIERKKRGFGTPMGAWLKQDLAPLMQELLSEDSIERRGLFDPGTVRALMGRHETKRIDGTDRLLALMNLEIWARMYVDRRTPEDVTAELEGTLV